MTQTAAISLHRNKYSQELHYYPFAVKLGRRIGSCNTLNDLFNKICVANNTKDFNLDLLSIIIERNESKTLTKHISCKCKCKLDGRKYHSNQNLNMDKRRCNCEKNHIY